MQVQMKHLGEVREKENKDFQQIVAETNRVPKPLQCHLFPYVYRIQKVQQPEESWLDIKYLRK